MVKLILDYIVLMLRAVVSSCRVILYGSAVTTQYYLVEMNKALGNV